MKININKLIFCFPNYNRFPEFVERANKTESHIEIKNSMEKEGMRNPLLVEDMKNGIYKVWIGNQRLAAAQLLGWEELECIILEDVSPKNLKKVKNEIYK